MAQLYVVRHAKAGERRLWDGDDVERPLSKKGWRQAEIVGERLAQLQPTTLISSPYVRCVQTLEPLGALINTAVVVDPRLSEDEPFEPVLDLLADVADRTVLSTHGDVIPATMDALVRRGMKMNTQPDWRKAAVWVLKRNKRGEIVHATVWPPPTV
jgi:8-oxo-dGTP diphosphatase